MTRTRRGLFGLLAGGALALLAGRGISGLYADWSFYHGLGFADVWDAKMLVAAVVRGGAFVSVAVFAGVNFFAVRQNIVSLVLPQRFGDLEIAEAIPPRRLTLVALVLALAVALLGAALPHDWTQAALAWDRLAFAETEPYLERDLGFYVAWLPFERALQERATVVLVTIGLVVLGGYALTPSVRWSTTGLYVSAWVRRHLSLLAGGFVLLVGWDWRLDRYERLSDGSGIWGQVAGHSYFSAYDHRIVLPYLGLIAFLAMPVGAVLVWAGWRGSLRLTLALLSAMIMAGPVARVVLPLAAQGSLSTPDARRREQAYRNTSALFTRRAYGVDDIAGVDTLSLRTVAIADVSHRVSAWDPTALSASVAGDSQGGLVGGLVGGLAWRASPEGLEALVLRHPAAPGATPAQWTVGAFRAPRSDAAGLPYRAPTIDVARLDGVVVSPGYTGFALVSDPDNHIAAPSFASTHSRVALAWDLQDPRVLFRELPEPRPRLVTTRDVRARVRRAAPFLATGPTVTPVVRGDSLYWFVDLFTTAARYPLSESVTADGDAVRYAKSAGSAMVQAQTGRVMLIPPERPDPVLAYWMRRFPALFTPIAAAPGWIRDLRPPAVDAMLVQGRALARVGFQRDSVASRRLARLDDPEGDSGASTFFQYGADDEVGWALPVDIPSTGRALGLLVARGGAKQRTEFHAFDGPSWNVVLDHLQRSADSAGFGRGRPGLRRGRVQAIPTSIGPLWIQSYYQWPANGAPVLAGVAVRSPSGTRAGRTLAEALGEPALRDPLVPDAFRERVARLYDAMQAAQRTGDWRTYGEAWSALGRLIGRQ